MGNERTVDQITVKKAGDALSAADFNALVDAIAGRMRDGATTGFRSSGGMHTGQAAGDLGIIVQPAQILPSTAARLVCTTQSDTWYYDNAPLGSEGVSIRMDRVCWDGTNGKLLAYARTLTFDSAGKLGSITAETAYELAASEECEDETIAHTDTTNTFTEPQTFQNGTNASNIKGGTTAADQSNVSTTDQAHAAYYWGTMPTATISGLGQYTFTGTGSGQAALTFDGAEAESNRAATREELGLGSAATLNITTTVADPGSDSLLPTEKAVRDAIGSGGGSAAWGSITGTLADQTDLQNALDAKVPYTGATATVDLGTHSLALTGDIASATAPASNVFASQINGTAPGDAAWKNTGTNSGDVAAGDHNHAGQYATTDLATTSSAGLGYGDGSGGVKSVAGMYSLDFNTPSTITIADEDLILIYDVSASSTCKITASALKTYIGSSGGGGASIDDILAYR